MTIKTTAVCIACCRPDAFKVWHKKWKEQFDTHNVDVYCAWDSDNKPPKTKGVTFIKRKEFPSYVPTHTSACRSAAVKRAYEKGYDMYIFLDDDVWPPLNGSDIIAEYKNGFDYSEYNPGYFDVGNEFLSKQGSIQGLKSHFTRGFPYKERHITPVVAQYGGWDNVPDLDARDTQRYEDADEKKVSGWAFRRHKKIVPKYMGFTGCFMNCAFRHEVVPALFHLHQGTDRCGYDRFDDIWASLILKRICDHFNWTITINGDATCWHDRLSNTTKSVFQENHGHTFNEDLWENLQRVYLDSEWTFNRCYYNLCEKLPNTQTLYAKKWIEGP